MQRFAEIMVCRLRAALHSMEGFAVSCSTLERQLDTEADENGAARAIEPSEDAGARA